MSMHQFQCSAPILTSRTAVRGILPTSFSQLLAVVLIGTTLLASHVQVAYSQPAAPAPKVLSTKRPFVVKKVYKDSAIPDEELADFDDFKAAERYRNEVADAHTGNEPFYFGVYPRPVDEASSPDAPQTPEPPFDAFKGVREKNWVDPNVTAPGSGSNAVLAGKSGIGSIGKYKVTMTFTGTGNRGTVTISGDANGQGTWEVIGTGLVITTEYATYRATIENDQIIGLQLGKAAGSIPVKVSLSLQATPPKPKEVPSTGPYRAWIYQSNRRIQIFDHTVSTAEEAINEARIDWEGDGTRRGWKYGNGEVTGTVATDANGRVLATFGRAR